MKMKTVARTQIVTVTKIAMEMMENILKAMFNQCDLERECKSYKKFIVYRDTLNGTGRVKDVRKELKSRYKSEYVNVIEMYDIITMIVTQMIHVERLNSAQSWMDDKTQRSSFENLNGSLGLWHGEERNDKE